LAGRLNIPFLAREIQPDEFGRADEAFLTSTPNCLLPVTKFNGHLLGSGQPGKKFRQLLSAWNEFLGVNIAEQAQSFARR
jgi:branched-chain amino acid aminotransferase